MWQAQEASEHDVEESIQCNGVTQETDRRWRWRWGWRRRSGSGLLFDDFNVVCCKAYRQITKSGQIKCSVPGKSPCFVPLAPTPDHRPSSTCMMRSMSSPSTCMLLEYTMNGMHRWVCQIRYVYTWGISYRMRPQCI